MIEEIKNYYNNENCIKKYSEDVESVGLWASEQYLLKKYLSQTDKILDLGCGAGRTTINLYKNGFKNITGLDIANNLLNFAQDYCKNHNININFVNQSATEIQFDNETFDAAIFSYNGLMCIPGEVNRVKAVKEVCRVLKPNGVFIFSAHDRENPRFAKFWQEELTRWKTGTQNKNYDKYGDRFLPDEFGTESYIHIPNQAEVKSLCENNGFKVLESVNNLMIGTPDERNRETIFWVVKKV